MPLLSAPGSPPRNPPRSMGVPGLAPPGDPGTGEGAEGSVVKFGVLCGSMLSPGLLLGVWLERRPAGEPSALAPGLDLPVLLPGLLNEPGERGAVPSAASAAAAAASCTSRRLRASACLARLALFVAARRSRSRSSCACTRFSSSERPRSAARALTRRRCAVARSRIARAIRSAWPIFIARVTIAFISLRFSASWGGFPPLLAAHTRRESGHQSV